MRTLLFGLSFLACAALVMPAYAQEKQPPPDDQPAQQDKNKDEKDKQPPPPVNDLDKNQPKDQDRPAQDKALPDQPAPDKPAQPAQDRTAQDRPLQNQPDKGAGVEADVQRVSGKIVSAESGQVVLRTDAGKEVTLYPSSQTKFMIDGRAARFSDFRVGSVVDAAYVVNGDRWVLNSLVVGEAAATRPAAPARPAEPAQPAPATKEGTLVEGTVVKVVGSDQVVIKTSDGKEITINVTPQTKYTLTEQGGAFVDLAPNMPVRMYYDTVDRRPVARSILRASTAPVRPRRP